MLDKLRPSGLPVVGSLPWGAHFCQFYEGREELVDSLVPYFKAGLDNNERCLWVTSEPLRAEDARTALRQVVPDLVERERRHQIEIINHQDWYARTGKADPDSTLHGWVEREDRTLTDGFAGMRLTGNAYWVERSDWKGFVIVVRDAGPGISEKDHERIFERFVQAGSQTFAGGFGLGLWIVNQMVEAHQGSVTLSSRPGAGATFTLMLPLD
ncbi:MEDS domain-containing protein [Cystobacter fuscus]